MTKNDKNSTLQSKCRRFILASMVFVNRKYALNFVVKTQWFQFYGARSTQHTRSDHSEFFFVYYFLFQFIHLIEPAMSNGIFFSFFFFENKWKNQFVLHIWNVFEGRWDHVSTRRIFPKPEQQFTVRFMSEQIYTYSGMQVTIRHVNKIIGTLSTEQSAAHTLATNIVNIVEWKSCV